MSIFMNVNENIRNERKIVEKNTNYSAANYPRVPKLTLYQCLDIVLKPNGRIGKM